MYCLNTASRVPGLRTPGVSSVLRFAEEIMLLILDDDSGQFARVPKWSLHCALAGGVLMDLALENRIDTDPGFSRSLRLRSRRRGRLPAIFQPRSAA